MTTTTRGLAALALGLATAASLLAPQTSAVAAPTAPAAATVSAAPAASSSVKTANRASWETAVLTQLNAERAANGLKPLERNKKLDGSAHKHNLAMAKKNLMSHQVKGEKDLGKRVTAAKYRWSTCGENIAWNSDRSEAGVLALETMMYEEVAPNDGHRRNILSTSFTEVGVDVIEDKTHHKVWLTTDFGRPR
ncbi:Uncharacterized conserved protein YkwD, contains CAP (CSP/antigen 5/PR1) domain [Microlunatus sagamiharensis]|uniref:Uncharacterized conserved protein YkwD, contains CAP (CSP/antigen 5/PR1) domain n=1 Tax=Microlunatus sagamiharensis TaxID=546874 RepID=A0A1H2NCM0_9ACTN|nr:CAP domain-containing protein [Microlunatus sagamiharensis]SDV03229.1 Uncharacterized conserved protein YkwD, contains CAP (CSP/antigen 5/PR1) domain [Microlunatus sagamiharensis]